MVVGSERELNRVEVSSRVLRLRREWHGEPIHLGAVALDPAVGALGQFVPGNGGEDARGGSALSIRRDIRGRRP